MVGESVVPHPRGGSVSRTGSTSATDTIHAEPSGALFTPAALNRVHAGRSVVITELPRSG